MDGEFDTKKTIICTGMEGCQKRVPAYCGDVIIMLPEMSTGCLLTTCASIHDSTRRLLVFRSCCHLGLQLCLWEHHKYFHCLNCRALPDDPE